MMAFSKLRTFVTYNAGPAEFHARHVGIRCEALGAELRSLIRMNHHRKSFVSCHPLPFARISSCIGGLVGKERSCTDLRDFFSHMQYCHFI